MGGKSKSSARPEEIEKLFRRLREAYGIDFQSYKQTTIQRRLARRMSLHKIDGVGAYLRFLEKHPEELEILQKDLLINVTCFFREPRNFEHVKKSIFPVLTRKRAKNDPIRLWVPACSTGEEVYSLGVLLLEYLRSRSLHLQMQIFATDVSEDCLKKARAGIYSTENLKGVSPDRLRRFFVREGGSFRVHKSLRDLCIFARQNVIADPPFSKIDLISCRNLLIYLEPTLQKRVLSIFHYALKPSGFLILGSSENIRSQSALFKVMDKKRKIFEKRPTAMAFHSGFSKPTRQEPHARTVKPTPGSKPHRDLPREAVRPLLHRPFHPSVLSDEEIAVFREVLRRFEHEDKRRKKKRVDSETQHLRQELAAMREYLQSVLEEHEATTEELRSANEESVSANEELQSTNEELETSKEELQVANEELVTLNEELQKKHQALKTHLRKRIQSERKLKESEERFRLLVGAVKEYAIFMMDTKGHIMSWNEGAQRIKGYTADEIVGKHFSAFYTQGDREAGKPDRELEIALREGFYAEEGWRVRKDGSLFWASVLITTVKDESGKVRGFAKVTRDMTSRKNLEEALQRERAALEERVQERTADLRKANEDLQIANQVKSEFTAMVTHELRTPLCAIKDGLEIVIEDESETIDAENRENLAIVKRNVDRLARLVDNVLDFQRLDRGLTSKRLGLHQINELVQESIAGFLPIAKKKGLNLVSRATKDLPPVSCDRDMIAQVLANLISNAIRFSNEGSIVVTTEPSKEGIRVSVRDQGMGIREEDRPELFKSFSQLTGSKGRITGGSGLGLAISQKIVSAHKGHIGLEQSAPDEGSTFFFTLPREIS